METFGTQNTQMEDVSLGKSSDKKLHIVNVFLFYYVRMEKIIQPFRSITGKADSANSHIVCFCDIFMRC